MRALNPSFEPFGAAYVPAVVQHNGMRQGLTLPGWVTIRRIPKTYKKSWKRTQGCVHYKGLNYFEVCKTNSYCAPMREELPENELENTSFSRHRSGICEPKNGSRAAALGAT